MTAPPGHGITRHDGRSVGITPCTQSRWHDEPFGGITSCTRSRLHDEAFDGTTPAHDHAPHHGQSAPRAFDSHRHHAHAAPRAFVPRLHDGHAAARAREPPQHNAHRHNAHRHNGRSGIAPDGYDKRRTDHAATAAQRVGIQLPRAR
ncbi:MAG: hypothetical protein M3R61_03230 [Chloroflexota bacterium]|nr:hypothetical protein [Chloroflexota bacterium]